jgi:1,2-diacylglycerol 3-alpha-glucosyltransferase
MNILMICDFFHEKQQYQENLLVKYYLKLGHDVTIVTSTITSVFDYYSGNYDKNIKSHEYCLNGFTLIRLPFSINVLNKLRKLSKLKKVINKIEPDLIYVHTAPLNISPALSYKNKNKNCRVIFDSHADFSNSANNWMSLHLLHKIFYRIILNFLYKRIDKIYYVTPNGGEFLNKLYNIPHNKMELLPLGADIDYINEINEKNTGNIIRKDLNIGLSDFVIFSGGKLTRAKKIELVIKAFLLLNEKNTHLIIIGDTKDKIYREEILTLINSHPRIHFIGWVDGQKAYDYMSACDIAVFPASQSVLWQQAIGSGLPLIIGQIEGQDVSYLNKNENIFMLEKDAIHEIEICNLISLLYEDVNILLSMKKNAIKTTNEFLSYDLISKASIE